MPNPRRLALILILAVALAVAAFFFLRQRTAAAAGPLAALCPGPDHYGYTCGSGAAFTYYDAVDDTRLYADDGVIDVDLPFPFTFYGATYERAAISSNGNLQFDSRSATFLATCLDEPGGSAVGALVAPYWMDLTTDLAGSVETATIGEAPNRIFVVEWQDVPLFAGDPGDGVTFEIQLFEANDDILFLYQDVTTEVVPNGAVATIGLQHGGQGRSLQFSCRQPAVSEATGLLFAHPDRGNDAPDAIRAPAVRPVAAPARLKGPTAELLAGLARDGRAAPPRLHQQWLNGEPWRQSDWAWADLTGDGVDDLVALWWGAADRPDLARIALVADPLGTPRVLLDRALSDRATTWTRPALAAIADLTGDGRPDILLTDATGGHLQVVVANEGGAFSHHALPLTCRGDASVRERQIQAAGCGHQGRAVFHWADGKFVLGEKGE